MTSCDRVDFLQVWDLLHAGRSSGATAAPKWDPIYAILNTANVWAGWGDADEEWTTMRRYDPVAQLFAAATTAPTVRSKYDIMQVFSAPPVILTVLNDSIRL